MTDSQYAMGGAVGRVSGSGGIGLDVQIMMGGEVLGEGTTGGERGLSFAPTWGGGGALGETYHGGLGLDVDIIWGAGGGDAFDSRYRQRRANRDTA